MAAGTVKFSDKKQVHSLYQKLSDFNGELKSLTLEQTREKLKELKLNDKGSEVIIRKRYKQYVRNSMIKSDPSPPAELARGLNTNPMGFEYLIIVDFEATCEEHNPRDYIHEVIEFPALLFNMKELKVVDTFHSYCRPMLNPKLSEFCIKLTGIDQAKVDSACSFKDVFKSFSDWLDSKKLGNFSLATDCPWDIKHCLFPQCALAGISFPEYAAKWIDIRKLFSSFYQIQGGNLSSMLSTMDMQFEGREHCGLDDAQNIVRITSQMLQDGCIIQYNRFISPELVKTVFKRT